MTRSFGPWSTAMNGTTPELSTFWKRRMAMLPSIHRMQARLSRRELLALGGAGLASCALPTLRAVATAAGEAGRQEAEKAKAGRIFVHLLLKADDPNDPASAFRGFVAIDPETGEYEKLGIENGHSLRVSPDGQTVVYGNEEGTWTNNLSGTSPGRIADVSGRPTWSADGRQIVLSYGKVIDDSEKPTKPVWSVQTSLINSDGTGTVRKLPVPETDFVDDWSPDGGWFVTSSDRHAPYGRGYQLYVMRTDGTDERRLTKDGLNVFGRFSPDGKRIVYTHQRRGRTNLHMVNFDGTGFQKITDEENISPSAGWSPDAKRLAVVLHDLTVRADGKKTLHFGEGDFRVEVLELTTGTRRRLPLPPADFISGGDWA